MELKLVKKQPVARFVNVPFELVTPENMGKYLGRNRAPGGRPPGGQRERA